MARFSITYRASSQGKLGCGGRLFLTLFFGIFLVLGLAVAWFALRDAWRATATRSWTRVDCAILESRGVVRSEGSGEPYLFEVRYRYNLGGRDYTSQTVSSGYKGSSDYAEVQRLVDRYPPGSKAVCFANPEDPAEAVLEHEGASRFFLGLLPLIFAAVGGGGIYFIWRGWRKAKAGQPEAISAQAARSGGRWAALAIFSVFSLAGAGFTIAVFVLPVLEILDAKGWRETPCTIVSSQVRSHSGDDGPTYSVDILFAYRVNGKEYRSNRFHFATGSSSGYEGKKAIVDRYPRGKQTLCYVNPKDPADSVIERGFTSGLLVGLIPLVFLLGGAVGLFFTVRVLFRKKAIPAPEAAWLPKGAVPAPVAPSYAGAAQAEPSGPVTLKAATSRLGRLIGTIVFAIFWNGAVLFIFWKVISAFRQDAPDWFLAIFAIIFVLVGLVAIVASVHKLLGLFNPRPTLVVSSNRIPLGGTVDLQWTMFGRVDSIQRFTLSLEGREEAVYTRGTDTVTDKRPFATIPIADTADRFEILSGSAKLAVPPDTMHTFAAEHNRIVWTLRMHADVRWWPDVKEEFEIFVLPAPRKG